MAIQTRLAPSYSIRMILIAVLSFIFTIWGLADAIYILPNRQAVADKYAAAQETLTRLEEEEKRGTLNASEIEARKSAYEYINSEQFEGGAPQAPSPWDRFLRGWLFIACLPVGIWYLVVYLRKRKIRYTLEDDGTLVLPGGRRWSRDEIRDIDMSIWMKKSVATVEHTDGTREKLDDFIHKDAYRIVGAIANERYPDAWQEDAKPVKHDEQGVALDDEDAATDATADDTGAPDHDRDGEASEARSSSA